MARPLSEEKRDAILAAAAENVAAYGLSAQTSRIAADAKVAEGTVFSYFKSKDALLNELYVTLKQEIGMAMIAGFRRESDFRGRWRMVWDEYIDWGALNPARQKALKQLNVSDRITVESRDAALRTTRDIATALLRGLETGALRSQPPAFVGATFEALGEMTLDFIAREPDRLEEYKRAGFETLWRAIATRP
ncbi:TetR/AcrR family transcriptional regulator [Bradyrhizobium sp. CB1717]|uniref:TetR/AcrR family transcriptional regulator n=1 Tax=Bradyrhizobium sp. CB1717 TaxID=3039154 RepID=UPI0024B0616C|nr:TetR/AcrR family transcriptional regulator [Bradyrhizobium sp. CB1717]WFU28105.1 TetR/AcrR family transcriptional regulator [Bradyrhizobium sp. CB1717]